jgi:hypothetical protein
MISETVSTPYLRTDRRYVLPQCYSLLHPRLMQKLVVRD